MNYWKLCSGKYFCLCLLLLLPPGLKSQDLIPFLSKEGLYGYADKSGNLIIKPDYKEAPFFDSTETALVLTPKYERRMLLKNGVLVPMNGPVFQGNPVNITDAYGTTKNEILDLYHFVSSKEYLLLDKKTGKYILSLQYKNTDWTGFDQNATNSLKLSNFYKGYKRILKATGVNFIDINLNEVFKTDFDEGVYTGGGYFILKMGGKMGVMDLKSNLIVPFEYNSIGSTMKDGIFILNYHEYTSSADTVKPSIYDSATKKINRLEYQTIKPLDDVLLVQLNGKQGLIDYSGKTILPCKYQLANQLSTSNQEWRNTFIFWSQKDTAILVNSEGKILTNESFLNLNYYFFKYKSENQDQWVHHEIFTGKCRNGSSGNTEIRVLDKDLNTMFTDTVHATLRPVYDKFGRYFYSFSKKSSRTGVVSENGKILIPAIYTQVNLDDRAAFVVKLDTFFGLIGLDGREILPCKYENIQLEHDYKLKSSVAWAKKHNQNLYFAYGMDGKPVNIRPFIYPTSYEFRPYYPSNKYENGKYFSKTRSGVEVESNLISEYNLINSGGVFLYYKIIGKYLDLRNENFDRIIPKGFRAMMAYNTMLSGLFAVESGSYYDETEQQTEIKETEEAAVRPAPKPFDPDAPPMVEEVASEKLKVEPVPELVYAEEYHGVRKEGIINNMGKWVMPPVEDIHYTVINKYLIEEKIESYRKPDKFTLHRLTNKKAPKIENLSRIQPSKKSIAYITKYLPRKSGGLEEFSCLIDSSGNELTPFNLVKIVSYHDMGDTLTVKIWKDNGKNETAFMDFNGKILWSIGDLEISEIDKKNNRLICRNPDNGEQTLRDLKGNLVMDTRFKELSFKKTDALYFAGQSVDGKKLFFDTRGFNLAVSSEYDSLISISNSFIYPISTGEIMIVSSTYHKGKSSSLSLLYSASGKLIRAFDARFQPDHEQRDQTLYWKFYSDQYQKYFYINKETGQKYVQ